MIHTIFYILILKSQQYIAEFETIFAMAKARHLSLIPRWRGSNKKTYPHRFVVNLSQVDPSRLIGAFEVDYVIRLSKNWIVHDMIWLMAILPWELLVGLSMLSCWLIILLNLQALSKST